ncbi:hypothetical protein CRE_13626 [Caenorhabditis remanei]|uniref:Uncharacterized protein n=1 Tax=Caenorhabditis remanei TaxID=31234 RepID=E3N1C2_CAERE|nr:hypothetical protein CRE_13626 [Caenorhabditis remanei]
MIFLVNNQTYFFAVFLMNYKRDFGALSIFLLILEIFGFLWGAILTIRGCLVITQTRVFNRNLNICLSGILMQWMENMVGRLMIMPYQKGWIQLPGNDPKKIYSEFLTNSTSEMILVKNSFCDFPFFSTGSILLSHYMVFAILALTGITVERSLATFWINDYEKKPRRWIPIFVLLALQTTSWLIAFSAINVLLNIYIWLVIGVLVLITNFVLFGYIWYWNIRVHRVLDNSIFIPSKYTLQARFQAKENARSLEFLKVTVFTVSLVLLLQCLFFILQSSNVFQDYEVILYYLVDFCNAGHPVVLIPMAMISVPVWKKKFFGHLHCVKKVCSRKTLPMVDVVKQPISLKMETDQYFSQFNKAWN